MIFEWSTFLGWTRAQWAYASGWYCSTERQRRPDSYIGFIEVHECWRRAHPNEEPGTRQSRIVYLDFTAMERLVKTPEIQYLLF